MLVRKCFGYQPFGRPRRREDNIKIADLHPYISTTIRKRERHENNQPVISVRVVTGHNRFNNQLKLSGNYMYHLRHFQYLCILPTECIFVFRMILRINSDYFLEQR
jgi:hypothetical protein